MALPKQDFPPVRAALFDMDGLLLNTEDIYTICHNILLAEYGGPPMEWSIKSQLQGRPASEAIALLLNWAKLTDIDVQEYIAKLTIIQAQQFPLCKPLPGVETLLGDLKATAARGKAKKVHIALATSSHLASFDVKTQHWKEMFTVFTPERRVLGDDARIPKGRGKPSPDIYQLALRVINESLEEGEEPVKPEECLVFEDSVPGVESGRRAGMRVVWVPNPGLAIQYKGREDTVLAGRGEGSLVDVHELGTPGDGWGQQLSTLEDFPYEKYGIATGKERA
ncbi:haloacid dehalogenase-like hydrolase [Phlyctema vagabunda]|uniref:Haloacid dehalogenase-like hydrolase n=1 Tax=Phlyctema vagabunda TaxID=108571 RepID=A0ABR4PUU0_9HELO